MRKLGGGSPWAISLAVLLVATACEKEQTPAPAASVTAPPPIATSAAAPNAPPASKLRALLVAKEPLLAFGTNGEGVVLGGKTGILVSNGKLSEVADLARGLENPRWSERVIVGASSAVIAIAGKRDPDSLQKGDHMMYMEDPSIGADRTVFRAWQRNAWVRVGAVNEGEKLGGIGRFQDRVIAAIEMAGGKDYRFVLVAGKPGIALPAPSAAEKPPEPQAEQPQATAASADADAAGAGDAGATPSAEPAAATEKPKPVKPLDPNVPNPDPSAECETRLVPRGFDGLPSGEAILVGRVCPGSGDYWAEHWAPKKRKASFEKIPQPPDGALTVVMIGEGHAVVAARGTRFAIERLASGVWQKLEPPGTGDIQQIAASPGGKLWLVAGGRVFSRASGGAFVELALPSDKQATLVRPADGDTPFVVAGNELLGPAGAISGPPVEIAGGATALCNEPYVIVQSDVKRAKKYPDAVAKVEASKVPIVSLVFGHRGMAGIDSIQAKVADMKTAEQLAKALGGAKIVCGAPRTEAPVPK